MPLDDLVGAIETLQQRIRQHGPSLRENEIRTRMALIDPLLQALGWDVSNPALVTPEYAVSSGRADYALLDGGRVVAAVEAKSLGTPLEQDRTIDQLVRYAFTGGIPYAILTDGDIWRIYNLASPAMVFQERLIQSVAIDSGAAVDSALKLLLLWRPNLASRQPTPASAPIFTAAPASQSSPAFAPASDTTPPPHQPAPAPDAAIQPPPGWVALSSFNWRTGMNPPQSIRFPDGNEYQVQRWRNLIERTASWLWGKGMLTHSNLPVPVGRSARYVVNTEPVHRTGNPFTTPHAINGTPLIAEVNVGGIQAISYARTLLTHCGVNPADVFIQTGP